MPETDLMTSPLKSCVTSWIRPPTPKKNNIRLKSLIKNTYHIDFVLTDNGKSITFLKNKKMKQKKGRKEEAASNETTSHHVKQEQQVKGNLTTPSFSLRLASTYRSLFFTSFFCGVVVCRVLARSCGPNTDSVLVTICRTPTCETDNTFF